MEQIRTLIKIFNAGNASLEEQTLLLELLTSNEPELKNLLATNYYKDIDLDNLVLSEEKSQTIFQFILAHKDAVNSTEDITNTKVIKGSFKWLHWVAAASIIAISIIGTWYFRLPDNKQSVATTTAPTQPTLQQLTNSDNRIKQFILQDGSTVELAPKSAISYYQPFIKARDISLNGVATFKVAKDAARPFTVYANHIATTALGTTFEVASFQQSVKVVLIEGRVVVRPGDASFAMKDTYLQPGQQLAINKFTGVYAVTNTSNSNIHNHAAAPSSATNKPTNLAFCKAPLTEVITNIGNRYNILIQYDKQDVQNLSFTGTFTPSDSLLTILTIICNTNDLSFKLDKGMVIINKQ